MHARSGRERVGARQAAVAFAEPGQHRRHDEPALAIMVRPLFDQRGQALAVELPEGLPEVACAARALVQVASNLLSNAAKFTPEGGHVTLRAAVLPGPRVRVEVQDDGPGIAPADQVHLFTYWQQVGGKHEHHMKGSGIGLALCQAIVQRAGGHLAVCSEPGMGTTFAFTLPVVVRETFDVGL